MFTVRKQHLAAFEQAALEQFEDTMLAHLRETFSEECATLDEPALIKLIHLGIDRAATYGIEAEDDVCLYIDLMMLFGQDFDRDPGLPWARAILQDGSWEDVSAKVNHLYDVGIEKLEQAEAGAAQAGGA